MFRAVSIVQKQQEIFAEASNLWRISILVVLVFPIIYEYLNVIVKKIATLLFFVASSVLFRSSDISAACVAVSYLLYLSCTEWYSLFYVCFSVYFIR